MEESGDTVHDMVNMHGLQYHICSAANAKHTVLHCYVSYSVGQHAEPRHVVLIASGRPQNTHDQHEAAARHLLIALKIIEILLS